MRTTIIITLLGLSIAAATTNAQAPEPVVVQASGRTATASTAGAPAAADSEDGASKADLLQSLQQLKAANDEIVKRQLATLEQLEEIEKAAAEIKIFAGRS